MKHEAKFETRAIHAGQPANPENGALMTPVYFNSTYEQTAPGDVRVSTGSGEPPVWLATSNLR